MSSIDTLSKMGDIRTESSSILDEGMSYLESLGLLDLLERVAEGIVAVIGTHCEVVVHDFSDPEHSAVVVTGDVTHRKPGAPVPDLSFISGELDKDTPDQLNYQIKIDGPQAEIIRAVIAMIITRVATRFIGHSPFT